MSQALEIEIGGKEFYIPKWDLKKVLSKQGLITKIVSEPLSMILALGDDVDESIRLASLVEAIMKTLSTLDMSTIAPQILEGTLIRNEEMILAPSTIAQMDKMNVDFSDILGVCAAVIKHNYGSALKNGLGETLEKLMEI